MLPSSEIIVYDAMMELFSSSFEQEEACVIFLGDLAENAETSFKLFPNPVSSNISINTESNVGNEFQIYDHQGRILKTGILSQTLSSIDISSLNSGVYFFKVNLEVLSFVKE